MQEPNVTFTGNVGKIQEPKDVGGRTVVNFTVGATPRVKDGQNGYKDGETIWFECAVWGHLADNFYDRVSKGDPVTVVGRIMEVRHWSSNGREGTSVRVTADEVGMRVPPYPVNGGRGGSGWQRQSQQAEENWSTPDTEVPF